MIYVAAGLVIAFVVFWAILANPLCWAIALALALLGRALR